MKQLLRYLLQYGLCVVYDKNVVCVGSILMNNYCIQADFIVARTKTVALLSLR